MRFAELDEWGLRDSVLHRRDPRAKILAVVFVLVAISRGDLLLPAVAAGVALILTRLPVLPVLFRGAVVLPFSLSFAIASLFAGNTQVALHVLLRSYLSAVCVVILLGCTPLLAVLDGLRRMGAPILLLEVIQFVYRYMTLIGDQSRRTAGAATARGVTRTIAAIAGSLGVLFARSYGRAEAVHRAMLARGYTGSPMPQAGLVLTAYDALTVSAGVATLMASLLRHP